MDGFDLDGPKNRILETIFSFTYVSQWDQNNFKVDFKNCMHLRFDEIYLVKIFGWKMLLNTNSENISLHDCSV